MLEHPPCKRECSSLTRLLYCIPSARLALFFAFFSDRVSFLRLHCALCLDRHHKQSGYQDLQSGMPLIGYICLQRSSRTIAMIIHTI